MGRQSAIVGQSHIDFIGHILSLSGIGTSNIPALLAGMMSIVVSVLFR